MIYKVGDTYRDEFSLYNTSDALVAADSTPSGLLVVDGTDTATTVTVNTTATTGRYKVSCSLSGRSNDEIGYVAITAIVGSKTQIKKLDSFRIDSSVNSRASQTSLDNVNSEVAGITDTTDDILSSVSTIDSDIDTLLVRIPSALTITGGKVDVNDKTGFGLADNAITNAKYAAGSYWDKLNITGNVASSSEVTSIQNNTRVVRSVPAVIERPDGGTQDYVIHLYTYDEIGNMEAPDSAPTVALTNQTGTDLSARLDSTTMTLVGTGHYKVTYTAAVAHTLEQLLWEFTVVESGNTRLYGNTSIIVDTTAVDFTATDRTTLGDLKNYVETYLDDNITSRLAEDGNVHDMAADYIGDVFDIRHATGNVTGSVGSINGITFPTGFGTLTVANIQSGLATSAALTTVGNNVSTLITRIPSAITITGGKVDVNDKTGFELSSTGVTAVQSGLSTSAAVSAVATGVSSNNALLTHGSYGLAQLVRSTTPANTLNVDVDGKADSNADVGDIEVDNTEVILLLEQVKRIVQASGRRR